MLDKHTKRDNDSDVKGLLVKAKSQSDDPYQQFRWLRQNSELSKKQSVKGMVDWLQDYFSNHEGEITVADGSIDRLMRGFGEAMNRMQENTPEGVYAHMYHDLQDILDDIVKKRYNRENQ